MKGTTEQTALATSAQMLMFVSGYIYRLLRFGTQELEIRWTALLVLKDLQLLGPCSQRTLAAIEQVQAPTMTVLIRQMEQRGWVFRIADSKDTRSKIVKITRRGREKLKRCGQVLQRRLEAELGGMRAGDVKALAGSLGPLQTALLKQVDSFVATGNPVQAKSAPAAVSQSRSGR